MANFSKTTLKDKISQVTEDEGLIDGEPLPVMVWIHGGAFRIGRYLDISLFLFLFMVKIQNW